MCAVDGLRHCPQWSMSGGEGHGGGDPLRMEGKHGYLAAVVLEREREKLIRVRLS